MTIPPPGWRELREGLDPAIAATPAPNGPVVPEPWVITPVLDHGPTLETVHRWLNGAANAASYDQAWPIERMAEEMAYQHAGVYSRPFLIGTAERWLGFFEVYRAGRDIVAKTYQADPGDLGLHATLGVQDREARRVGRAMLKAVLDGLLVANPDCRRVVAEPNASNRVVHLINRSIGFVEIGPIQLPHKKAILFAYPRTPEDLPTLLPPPADAAGSAEAKAAEAAPAG
mgnify:CR=1 FL=1